MGSTFAACMLFAWLVCQLSRRATCIASRWCLPYNSSLLPLERTPFALGATCWQIQESDQLH